jgi:putative SOS response-associated peptidase YedK
VPIVRLGEDGERVIAPARWMLVPSWAKHPSDFRATFNARGESLDAKPTFRDAFRRRRCVVPALDSCAIVTCEANAQLAPVHGRMPVMLSPAEVDGWLDPTSDPETLRALLRPHAAEPLRVEPGV